MSFDPTSAAPDDAFDPASATPDDAPPVRDVLREAVKTDPNAAAKAAVMSKKYSAPAEVLLRNMKDAELMESVDTIADKLQQGYKLEDAMRRSLSLSRQAHDDVDTLTAIEAQAAQHGTLRGWEGPPPTLSNISKGVMAALPQGMRTTRAGLRMQMGDFLTWLGALPTDPVMEANARREFDQAAAASAGTDPVFGNRTARSVYGGVTSLVRMLPGTVAAIALRNPAPALWQAGVEQQAQSYGEFTGRGAGGAVAFVAATASGGVEALTEIIPGKYLAESFGKVGMKGLVKNFVKKEARGEQFATFFEDAIDTATANPEKTWEQFFDERPGRAYDTLVATITQAGLIGTANHVVKRLADREQQLAEKHAEGLKALLALADKSELRARNPDEFRQLMQTVADGVVYIDGEVLNQAPADVVATLPKAVLDQIGNAAASGGMVEVPVADVLAVAPGTPLEQLFVKHSRANPFSLSQTDAADVTALQERFKQEFDTAIAESTAQEETRQSAEAVRQTLLKQLNTAGRHSAQVNEAMSYWAGAFYATMAQRIGMTPEEMYAKYPLRVVAEASAPGSTLEDSGKRPGALTVEGYHYSKAQRQVLSGGAYGTGLKGSGYETYANAADKRLAKRVYFYADKGTGINPEPGVGGHAHRATLTNVYDANTDPLRLRKGSQTDFESALLDAGYSGYLDRLSGTQSAQVIMLGDQSIKPEYMGQLAKTTGAVVPAEGKRASLGRDQVVDAINDNKNLPSGSPTRARWSQLLEKVSPAEHAALKAAGVFDGNQDEALFKSELVKEFERKTETPVYEQGQEGPRVNFEVAPDPNNAELSDKWRTLPEAVKQAVSERVAAEIVPKVLKAAGATGEITAQVGSYLDDTNPSFALKVTKGDPDVVAKALGYALSQDSMMTLASSNFSGAEKVGAIHIAIGDKTAAEVAQIYKTLRAIEVDGENPIGGQSTSGGRMVVLNYSNVDTPALAELIDTALEGAYDVAHGDVFAAFPEKKDYDYADSKADPEGNEGLARQGARDARQEAAKLIDEAVENPEQFIKKEGQQDIGRNLAERVDADFEGALAEYNALPETQGGTVLNVDLARELSPEYRADRTRAAEVHDAASAFIKRVFAAKLAQPTPAGKLPLVAFMAGGTGAGKSTALSQIPAFSTNAEIVLDGTMSKLANADSLIRQALEAGREVNYAYVYRDPHDAFVNGALPRAMSEGRTAPLQVLAESHVGARATVAKLAAKYADHPNVDFVFVDNSRGYGKAEPVALAKIPEVPDNGLKEKLHEALQTEFEAGRISEPVYQSTRAEPENTVREADGAGDRGRAQPAGAQEVLNQDAAQPQTETPEFKAWFGDSKVVDAQGKPLTMYHGTIADFESFDNSKTGANDRGLWGRGHYFTSSPTSANSYALRQGDGARVIPVHVSIQNPLVLRTGSDLVTRMPDGTNTRELIGENLDGAKIKAIAMDGGHDGVVQIKPDGSIGDVVAFKPEQIKSATGNTGTFDPNNPSILGQGPRGNFNPKSLELVLSPTADLSTWFHETGHFYLEVLADLATQPGAPQQIADDVNKIMAWFGVKDLATWQAMSLDEKRRYHERFAESVEQYVMEGKAPSTELRPFFRRFRAWLMSVYGSLQSFLASKPDSAQTPLNDDIRRVMDRMLATDEQIQQANEIAGMVPDETADAEAAERLQRRSMADLKWDVTARDKVIKKLRRGAKRIEKDIRAKVTEEVNQMPEVLAKQALDKAQAEHDASPVAADMNTATIADAFGYPSTDAMYKAIERFGNKQDVIDALTERRMLEDHGDLVDDRAIEDAANEAVHNEARARSLATELRTQREMLNPRQDTGRVASNGAKITVNALVEAAKQFGNNVADNTVLKDLKAKVWQHTQAERRAARAWQEATASGKTKEAVKAKQDQLLNNAAAKAVIDAKNEAEKTFEFFKRVVKGNDEKVVDKGRDPDIVNAARAVLAAYGVETPTTKAAAEYLETVSKNDPETYNTIRPMVEGALQMAQPLESLTVEQLRSLHEEIQSLWFLAKRSRQMEVDGDLMDIEDAAAQLHERMEKIGIPDKVPGEESALTDADKLKRWLQFAGALLRRVEQWSEKMDGKFGGPFLRLVFQPVKDAAEHYRSDRVAYRKAFTDLVDKVAPSFTHKLIEAPELGYTFGKGHNGIGHAELMHAILHTGNESNLRKLLLGRNWGELTPDGKLDTTRWSAFITRLAKEGVLTREHFDFAQAVWDLLEKTKPQAQKAHRDVFGRYFNEVTATPFVDPFGVERAGGYLPAQADPMLVNDADLRSLAEIENENMAFAFPATNKGFTKSRVEYNRPLKLDLRTIPQHLDKVLLFSHMEPAVRGVAKLLRNKGVSQALNRIDPSAYSGMLLPWLNRSARQIVETPIAGDGGASRLLSTLRSRAGAALMFANISNSVQQLTGFLSAGVKVDSGHMMRAAAQMVAHPKQMIEAVKAQSEFMRNRMEGEIAHMTDLVNDIVLNHSLYQKAQAWSLRNTYFLQQAIDNTTGPIIWTAAYNQGLADGLSEKEAVRFADGTIRQTQQATSPEDVSRIETGRAYARIFTQFAGYFNMLANTNATALQQIASETGLKKGAGKALGVVFFGVLAHIWVAEAIAQAFKGGPDDKDHDGYLDDWLAAVFGMGTIKGLLAYVPFVGQLANAGINKFNSNPNDDRVSLSPTVGLLESSVGVPADVYNAINGKLNAKKAIEDVASLVNVVTGLPTRALARPVGYAAGVEQDKIKPTSAADAVRGVATGAASPASRQR